MPKLATHANDFHVCPIHGGGPVLPAAPQVVQVVGLQFARLADFCTCAGPIDVIFEGAAQVLVGGLPAAGMGDKTAHGGVLAMGTPTVLIGGPAFALPANVTIKGDGAFQNKVIRDMYLLSTTPTGRELLRRLEAAGEPITIVPEADPHNSFCGPNNPLWARVGWRTGSTVSYNPDVAITVYDSSGAAIDEPPQVVLGHELIHGLHNSEGTHSYETDPHPPASEPTIPREESSTIGTGSHNGEHPTENSMRQDLGLPRRDNHLGQNAPAPTGDLRPGGY